MKGFILRKLVCSSTSVSSSPCSLGTSAEKQGTRFVKGFTSFAGFAFLLKVPSFFGVFVSRFTVPWLFLRVPGSCLILPYRSAPGIPRISREVYFLKDLGKQLGYAFTGIIFGFSGGGVNSSSTISSTRLLSLNMPCLTPCWGVYSLPYPCCSPLRHSPLQQDPSVQYISPYPCLSSLSQFPLYTLPEYQVKIPYPCLRSWQYSPSYLSLFPMEAFQTPKPSLLPSLNPPLQKLPFLQQYSPVPWDLPWQQSPSQLSPLENYSLPLPCFRFCLKSPQYRSPFIQRWMPLPSAFPNFHSPTQESPFAPCQMPEPCLSPLSHSPSQNYPLGHWCLPSPSGLPLTKQPWQMQPLGNSSKPRPLRQSPCHYPSYTRSPTIMIPVPCLLPFTISPQQAPYRYFLRQRQRESLSCCMETRVERGWQFSKRARMASMSMWGGVGQPLICILFLFSSEAIMFMSYNSDQSAAHMRSSLRSVEKRKNPTRQNWKYQLLASGRPRGMRAVSQRVREWGLGSPVGRSSRSQSTTLSCWL